MLKSTKAYDTKKLTFVWLIAGLLAILALLSVYDKDHRYRISFAALQPDGYALEADLQDQVTKAIIENNGQFPEDISPELKQAAETSFSKEPTASHAIMTLGLASNGSTQKALVEQSVAVTRRNKMALAWMITDSARRSDVSTLLDYYDYSMRISRATADVLLPEMIKVIPDEQAVSGISRLLEKDPVWEEDFWKLAVAYEPGLSNLQKIRLQLAQGEDRPIKVYDRALLSNLVKTGQVSEAAEIYNLLAPPDQVFDGKSKSDLNIAGSQALIPFDWTLYSTATYTSGLDKRRKSLFVTVDSHREGLIASRLIELDRPRYEVSLAYETDGTSSSSELAPYLTVRCADADSDSETQRIDITKRSGKTQWQKPENCQFFWLNILFEGGDSIMPQDLEISNLALKSIS